MPVTSMTGVLLKTLIPSLQPRPITLLHLSGHSLSHFPRATRAMSSESPQRVFQLKVDPLTGNSEWVVIEDDDEKSGAFENLQQKNLLATTSYLDMLNDSYRNRAFRMAIEKTITKPCHVLDIGAGTGLLSMMAARAMNSSETTTGANSEAMVTACESFLPMVKLMRKVLHRNKMGSNINIINKRSDELKVGVDMLSRADVLVSEILDSELLGEGLIPTLQHAHDMLLVEDPLTVPYRATTYGQLVESTFLWKLHDLYGNEAKALDSILLAPGGLDSVIRTKSQQYAMHCDAISEEIKLLSEPFKIFEFDFWKRPESHGETELHLKCTDDGSVHAVVSWWILQLDCEGTIFYSTAPRWTNSPMNAGAGDWRDHWKQCVWFVPGGMHISKGEEVCLHAAHSETSITFELKAQAPDRKYRKDVKDFNLILPPERIAIYGDSYWRLSMLKAVRNALQERVNPLCLVADDSIFLALLVAKLSNSSHVIASFPGLRDMGAQYLHTISDANGVSLDGIEVRDKRKKYLTLDDTNQKKPNMWLSHRHIVHAFRPQLDQCRSFMHRCFSGLRCVLALKKPLPKFRCVLKVDLFIGEPYYHGSGGVLPWQNLRFWKERSILDYVLSDDALILPNKGILKACAMSLPDLWNSRCCLGEVEGFDHSVVNTTLGACGGSLSPHESPCLPYFIWQCGEIKELSDTFAVMEFDCSKPISRCCGKVQIEFTDAGICHGFALWIDWVMDAKNSILLSTGPDQRYWKQGVKLLAKPVPVGMHRSRNAGEYCSAVVDASFNPSSGELTVGHAFF